MLIPLTMFNSTYKTEDSTGSVSSVSEVGSSWIISQVVIEGKLLNLMPCEVAAPPIIEFSVTAYLATKSDRMVLSNMEIPL